MRSVYYSLFRIPLILALANAAYGQTIADTKNGNDEVVVHLASEHFGPRNKFTTQPSKTEPGKFERVYEGWNETNLGIGWRRRMGLITDMATQVGAYKDSKSRLSAYALVDYLPARAGTPSVAALNLGGFLAVTVTRDGPLPAFGATLRAELPMLNVTARVWPTVGRYVGGVAFEVGRSF